MKWLFSIIIIIFIAPVAKSQLSTIGQTEITEWQYGKNGALSITYDDGSYNQFTKALPIMERLKIPATFFVITGGIPGSKYHGRFIGRPVNSIIAESATLPTNDQNFLERCSAGGYLGYKGTITYVTRAASLYDNHETKEQAFKLMDELYEKVRDGDFPIGYQPCDEVLQEAGVTWNALKRYAANGYEIASHSITHASMPGLDSINITYELEKSKEEIKDELGPEYTFSAEVPYGYENERVMKIAYKKYAALRNRMPEPWLKEIDRASKQTPGATDRDYIQWQRGATTHTPLPLMKSWVDTAAEKKNTWLVLVIHGVDGLGYEALQSSMLADYFQYIKSKDNKLWIATFGDVTKYMREREHTKIISTFNSNHLALTIRSDLNSTLYNIPLTYKTYIPQKWSRATELYGNHLKNLKIQRDNKGKYVVYQVDASIKVIQLKNSYNKRGFIK